MNIEQLARKLATRTGKKCSATKPIINAFCKTLEEALIEGKKIVLTGFGTFYVIKSKPFKTRSIQGKEITVDDAVKVHFRAGRLLKKAINK